MYAGRGTEDELEELKRLLRRCVPAIELANAIARYGGVDPSPGVNLLAEVKLSCMDLVPVDKSAEG